jgi:hypothetical protein
VSDDEESMTARGAHSAWRSWLTALATDAEAAIAAALTYESLSSEARDAWLDAVESEAQSLGVPRVAVYAPLLGVETDGRRAARLRAAIAVDVSPGTSVEPAAWLGRSADGVHACVVVVPVYLAYSRMLVCRYTPEGGFFAASCGPLGPKGREPPMEVDGIAVSPAPVVDVVDELAHAVLADRREGRPVPAALEAFADLFAPDPKWLADASLAPGGQFG